MHGPGQYSHARAGSVQHARAGSVQPCTGRVNTAMQGQHRHARAGTAQACAGGDSKDMRGWGQHRHARVGTAQACVGGDSSAAMTVCCRGPSSMMQGLAAGPPSRCRPGVWGATCLCAVQMLGDVCQVLVTAASIHHHVDLLGSHLQPHSTHVGSHVKATHVGHTHATHVQARTQHPCRHTRKGTHMPHTFRRAHSTQIGTHVKGTHMPHT